MNIIQKFPLIRIENYQSKITNIYLTSNPRPFILTDNINSWRALSAWIPEFFKKKFGNLQLYVNPSLSPEISPYLLNFEAHTALMKLSEFINLMMRGNSCYLAEQNINVFKNLEEYYNFDDLIPVSEKTHKTYTSLWIGNNTRSGLHFDMFDNFLAQIYGRKKVILIDPKYIKFLYPMASNFSKSPINPFAPNFVDFPKFKKSVILEDEIGPGEVLFIPKGWYHYIYSPNQSISLNCWYGNSIGLRSLFKIWYRAGGKCWVGLIKDFIYYGILSRPYEQKLYTSQPFGKIMFDLVRNAIRSPSSYM